MSDYEWSDMPQDLALLLKEALDSKEPGVLPEPLEEWLLNEMKSCTASPEQYPRMTQSCPDLPEVGSEFCSKHMPKEDVDG